MSTEGMLASLSQLVNWPRYSSEPRTMSKSIVLLSSIHS